MSAFLAGLPDAERARILDLTAAVTEDLRAWALPYGIFEAVRFPAVAMSMAAAAPWLDAEALGLAARIPAWIYAIDDAFDRGQIPAAGRRAAVDLHAAVAAGGPAPPEPSAAALAEITAALARLPLWGLLGRHWAACCRRMLAGMAFECDTADALRRGAPPPTFPAYMSRGLHSIGVPLYLAGAWIIDGDAATGGRLPELGRLARASGRAVRLANDLRTHDKERAEGNFNALMLLGGSADAEAEVRRRLRASLARFERLAATTDGRAARLTRRVTAFAVELYADFDYHTVSADQLRRRARA